MISNIFNTVKREYLAVIIFGSFSNMAIWRLQTMIYISKYWDVYI